MRALFWVGWQKCSCFYCCCWCIGGGVCGTLGL